MPACGLSVTNTFLVITGLRQSAFIVPVENKDAVCKPGVVKVLLTVEVLAEILLPSISHTQPFTIPSANVLLSLNIVGEPKQTLSVKVKSATGLALIVIGLNKVSDSQPSRL